MEIKYIRCPKCEVALQVKNSSGERVKPIRCPKCGASLLVMFNNTKEGQEDTQKPSPDAGETRFAGGMGMSDFCIMCGEKKYSLQKGSNVVGRLAEGSGANVMIQTSDPYMSRRHAVITVIQLQDGTLKVVITNGRNKNKTFVNGNALEEGDSVVLSVGDKIQMGKTIMKITNQKY